MIQGVHHIAMKCTGTKEYQQVQYFYGTVLGLPVKRYWDGGMMFDLGGGICLEVFDNADVQLPQGVIRHFALATNDVDACVKAVSAAGYTILVEPKDIVIPSQPPLEARIAFCIGPLGEEIEFFHQK